VADSANPWAKDYIRNQVGFDQGLTSALRSLIATPAPIRFTRRRTLGLEHMLRRIKLLRYACDEDHDMFLHSRWKSRKHGRSPAQYFGHIGHLQHHQENAGRYVRP